MKFRDQFYLAGALIWVWIGLTPNLHAQADSSHLNLHVPSPNWADQIIYFVMTDRFNDGDSTNNDQGVGEYDPANSSKYSGGDIQGIIDKLEYIQNLGATALWLTPPVANQWWDDRFKFSGYHGYWAEHFKKVDKHLGTLVNYQQLSHHLHQRGMYLIQDIVVNHTGNFYYHTDNNYDPENPAKDFQLNEGSLPYQAPTQYPFTLNDATNPSHIAANIYHWTPDIIDYNNLYQRVNYELGSLDDINTQNVVVREVMRDSYGYWIRVVGVDGFRIDTVIYVEKEFWHDFMHSQSQDAPGIDYVAKATGREHFISFGEAFVNSEPYSDKGELDMASYIEYEGKAGLNSMLNFPLYFSINRVFAEGKPTHFLGYRLDRICNGGIYTNPFHLANFVDNHDTNRFLQNATKAGFQQALVFLFTIPGMPVIYMGTEQMFHEPRSAMFAGGWDSNGVDHFDEGAEMYVFIQQLAQLRKDNQVFSRGDLTLLQDTELGAGVLAYSRTYEGKEAIVVFNTNDEKMLLSNLETGLNPGTQLDLLLGYRFEDSLIVGENGKVTTELPGRAAVVLLVGEPDSTYQPNSLEVELSTDLSGQPFSEDIHLKGVFGGGEAPCRLVIDGMLTQAIPLVSNEKNTWESTIPISRFAFGQSNHQLTIYSPSKGLAASSVPFSVDIDIQGDHVIIEDPAGDDNGLTGTYTKPGDASYGAQMDIRQVKTTTFGGNLLLEITMEEVSSVWLPPNGFDHVLFHVFIDLPDQSGYDYLPMLNAPAPTGFEWDYAAYVAGWQMAYYSAKGATTAHNGTQLAISPTISIDEANQTINLQFSPTALGSPTSLSGAKIYLTTWDSGGGEGGFRGITKEGGKWNFGGSDDPKPVLILDDTEVILIP